MEETEERRIDLFNDSDDRTDLSVTLQDDEELVEYTFTNDELKHLCMFVPCSVNLAERNMYLPYERTMMKKFKAKHGNELDEAHYLHVTYKKFQKKFCDIHYERYMKSQRKFEKFEPEFRLLRKSEMITYMESLKSSSSKVELEITNFTGRVSEESSSSAETTVEQPTFANRAAESPPNVTEESPLNVSLGMRYSSSDSEPLNMSSDDFKSFLHHCGPPVDSESQIVIAETQDTYSQFNNNGNIVTSTQVISLNVGAVETVPFEQQQIS